MKIFSLLQHFGWLFPRKALWKEKKKKEAALQKHLDEKLLTASLN